MPQTLKKLKEEHVKTLAEAKAMNDMVEKENRGFNTEERSKWDAIMTAMDSLKDRIVQREKILEEDRVLSLTNGIKIGAFEVGKKDNEDKQEEDKSKVDEKRAFDSYLRQGFNGMSAEERSFAAAKISEIPKELRALTLTTTGGGYLVPQDFLRRLEDAKLPFIGLLEAGAEVINTDNGQTLPMPTANDTSNSGAIIGINTGIDSNVDPVFGTVNLGAFMYTSKIVLVPIQLMQDSAIDIEGYLSQKLGERIGRILNTHFTSGAGTTQPRGVMLDATLGVTAPGGQTASMTYADFVNLEHAVNRAYRPQSKWMMADSTLKAVKKLLDADNRPLWSQGIADSNFAFQMPASILGHGYIINDDMDALGASKKPVAFGDFSKYKIRNVAGVGLVRFGEKYMDALQVGFMAYSRHDGALVDAGTHPVVYFANAAS